VGEDKDGRGAWEKKCSSDLFISAPEELIFFLIKVKIEP
jgi:cell division protein FtsB